MKTKEKFLRRLWTFMTRPELEKPLMIAAPCLALVLAALLLLPVLRDAALPEQSAAPESGLIAAVSPQLPTEEPELPDEEEPAAESGEAEVVIVDAGEASGGWLTAEGKEYYLCDDGSLAVGLRKIDGKLYYFDEFGVKARSLGIDVSYYDNGIDWPLVKAQGIDYVIIRLGGRGWTTGLLYDDCRTREYLRGARSAGLRVGAYFYSTAVNPSEAAEEAAAALRAVGGTPLDFPIFIDMEFSGEYPEGRADLLTPAQRAEIAVAFCETIRNGGYSPGVYAGQNFLKAYLDYFTVSRYPIWLASYTVDNKLPFFHKRYDIWQFSDRGRVAGIGGYVDMDVIF